MRVLNYLELEDRLYRSGISTSVDHQREALRRADGDVTYLTTPWYGGDLVLAGLNRLVDGQGMVEFDVAHCNLIGPGSAFVARQAKKKDIPVVLHAHVTAEDFAESFRGSTYLAKPLRRYLRWFYSQADLVLCPSEYTRRTLEEYPIDAPIRSITNGIDLDSMAGHEQFREEYRDRYDLDGMVVFAVGSVFERKGVTTFCEVAQNTDYDFAWFGEYDGGLLASRTVRKWTKNPPENVTFTGWVEDKRGAFAAGDVFFFPSKVENQGLVVLEAMAAGKAVVLRDIPVFREYYEDGHDCLLCSTREEFEDALERLEENPDLRERLGENARETAKEHSLDRVAEELTDAYREIIPSDGPS
ncbi:glycosyltransferase family 4 protein [Halapricum hydrolyticum]|uniref:Glycosyltransferase family 4 protein n=1 Tax=Halapricum hydrolyticum TaxID=2979991 RepID=A0AAE3LGA5_9EURY|nr:glycosyltransferase family 4 protein [Halapricum hydrolyticum]MCU4719438.1 glycosyltransferase family 4 protein [Halapricum hydrolyticum]MCU4728447.1 glycosyltransferase family 4 protein [Halapricum hydrolyticum]